MRASSSGNASCPEPPGDCWPSSLGAIEPSCAPSLCSEKKCCKLWKNQQLLPTKTGRKLLGSGRREKQEARTSCCCLLGPFGLFWGRKDERHLDGAQVCEAFSKVAGDGWAKNSASNRESIAAEGQPRRTSIIETARAPIVLSLVEVEQVFSCTTSAPQLELGRGLGAAAGPPDSLRWRRAGNCTEGHKRGELWATGCWWASSRQTVGLAKQQSEVQRRGVVQREAVLSPS